VSHFLLVYDRRRGELLRKQAYSTDSDALRARFAAEHEFAGRAEIEVVVLSAESEDDLSVTHGRYFVGLDELASRIT
jgi:hypothetical protein